MPISGVIPVMIPYFIDRTGDQLNVIPLQGSLIYVYKGKLNKIALFCVSAIDRSVCFISKG